MKRLALGLAVVGALSLPAVAHAQTPSPSPTAKSPCQQSTIGSLPILGSAICSSVDKIPSLNPLGPLNSTVAGAERGITRSLASATGMILSFVMNLLGDNGGVNVFASWFTTSYVIVALVSLPFLLWVSIVAAAQAAAFGTGMDVVRAVWKALSAAALMTMPVLIVVEAALVATDWGTSAVLAGAGVGLHDNLQAFADRINTIGRGYVTGGGQIIVFVIVLVAAVGALLVWLNLLVRKAGIYVSVSLMPLALAGKAHKRSEAWSKRLSSLVGAVIASKLVIAIVLALAVSWFKNGDTSDPGNDLVFGAVLVIAGFLPMLIIRVGGSILEVHQTSKLMASQGAVAGLARRPISAVRHSQMLGFARGGRGAAPAVATAGAGQRRTSSPVRVVTIPANRAAVQAQPPKPGWTPPKPSNVLPAMRGRQTTSHRQRSGRSGSSVPSWARGWWPKGAKPLAPGQPRPPQHRKPPKPPATPKP